MNNMQDGYDELTADVRREESENEGSGLSALFAVGATLLLGVGLVFAAYKLGQKTGVEDPPTLVADNAPIREVPLDAGGRPVPNTDNDSYRMIDGASPERTGYVVRDGIVVAEELPSRDLEAGALEASELRSEIVDLAEIEPEARIEGAPDLTPEDVPDRRNERLVAGGAEILVPREAEVAAVAAAVTAEIPQLPVDLEAGSLQIAADTEIRAEPSAAATASLGVPFPRPKPPLSARPAAPASARETAPRPAIEGTQVAVNTLSRAPQPPALQQAQPTVQPPTIPPQPPGDAQLQLGALPSPQLVRAKWAEIKQAHPDLLGRLGLQVLPVRTSDGAQLFRLRVGPLPDGQSAARLCDQLRYRGVDCFVPRR